MSNPQHCEICRELIGHAIARDPPFAGCIYVCADCYGDDHPSQLGINRDEGAKTDMRYHGGLFHRGEW